MEEELRGAVDAKMFAEDALRARRKVLLQEIQHLNERLGDADVAQT